MPRNDDERFMRLAIDKAREGVAQGQTPFGACIVTDGRPVACEHNVVWATTDITAHAEVTAIRAACKALGAIDLSGCVIFSTTEPCPMCFSAIHWARISKISFGTRIEDAEAFGFNELKVSDAEMKRLGGSNVAIEAGLLRDENLQLFREWKARKDSRSY
jgi:guanine deaminase